MDRLRMVFGLALSLASVCIHAESPASTQDLPVAAGKRIYQNGQLLNGEAVRATVIGDTSLKGAPMACVSCHRRSGFGTVEGKVLTPAVTGDLLFQEKKFGKYKRPAYTDETLARAIREGIDPTGRTLEPLMPHYVFDDENLRALIAYLKTLSTKPAPGVTAETIRFATVITDDVKADDRKAMLEVLDRFIKDKNGGARQEAARAKSRTANVKKNHYLFYRKWELSTWELKGPPDSWRVQLEKYYQQQPVFALLSGISTGGWQPIHRFCEDTGIPCLLPITDRPVIASSDFYTLYFSRGLTLEAEIIARHLGHQARTGPAKRIVQVFRNDESGRLMSSAFRAAWEKQGGGSVENQVFARDQKFTSGLWKRFAGRVKPSVLLLWLPREDLAGLEGLAGNSPGVPETVYLSRGMIGEAALNIPAEARGKILLAYPYNLPHPGKPQFLREESWLRLKKITAGEKSIKAKAVFACALAGEALMHLENIFSREYFLERIEHMLDSSALTSIYPQVSLGPDQRYVVKGSYIVKPAESAGIYTPVSGWIIP